MFTNAIKNASYNLSLDRGPVTQNSFWLNNFANVFMIKTLKMF